MESGEVKILTDRIREEMLGISTPSLKRAIWSLSPLVESTSRLRLPSLAQMG